jgi:hypothetical protein
MSTFAIKLTAAQTINLERLLRGPFSAQQLLEALAHGNAPLWQALHPSLHSIAVDAVMRKHQIAIEEARAQALVLYPDAMKVLKPATGKAVRMPQAELASIIEGFRARYVAEHVPANPTAMAMHAPVLNRLGVFTLARTHADHHSIAEFLRETVGGADVARQFLFNEARRILNELEAGGGDRSLMTMDKTGHVHANASAVCVQLADEHDDLGYSSETIRGWLNKGLPKTNRRSSPR